MKEGPFTLVALTHLDKVGGRHVLPTEFVMVHAADSTARPPEPDFDADLKTLCGEWIRCLLPMNFKADEPGACPECAQYVSTGTRWQSRPYLGHEYDSPAPEKYRCVGGPLNQKLMSFPADADFEAPPRSFRWPFGDDNGLLYQRRKSPTVRERWIYVVTNAES